MLAAIDTDGLLSDEHFTSMVRCSKQGQLQEFQTQGHDGQPARRPEEYHGQFSWSRISRQPARTRLFKNADGREATLAYLGHVLTENRHEFVDNTAVTSASGTGERDATIIMLGGLPLTPRRAIYRAFEA